MERNREVARIIAREIARGSRKHWAGLHALALEEIKMSETTSGMNVQSSAVPAPIAPRVDQKNLVTGEDSRKSGDTAKASVDAIANAPGPRGETTEDESAGA